MDEREKPEGLTAHEFELLSYESKMDILFTTCSVCALKVLKHYQVNLYRVDGFYVEAWYNCDRHTFEKFETVKGNLEIYADPETLITTFRIIRIN